MKTTEKWIIATIKENYTAYKCKKHYVFAERNDIANGLCPYCKSKCKEIENLAELKEKFIKELGI